MMDVLERVKARRRCAVDVNHEATARYPYELDHIIPRYLGGRPKHTLMKGRGGHRRDWIHVWWYLCHPNIQVLCHECHVKKDSRHGRISPK